MSANLRLRWLCISRFAKTAQFCLLLTLSTFAFLVFLNRTFHSKRWSPSSPCYLASKHSSLNFQPPDLTLHGKAEFYIHRNALSSPLSSFSFLKGFLDI